MNTVCHTLVPVMVQWSTIHNTPVLQADDVKLKGGFLDGPLRGHDSDGDEPGKNEAQDPMAGDFGLHHLHTWLPMIMHKLDWWNLLYLWFWFLQHLISLFLRKWKPRRSLMMACLGNFLRSLTLWADWRLTWPCWGWPQTCAIVHCSILWCLHL